MVTGAAPRPALPQLSVPLSILLCWWAGATTTATTSDRWASATTTATTPEVLLLFTDHSLFATFDDRLQTRVNPPSKGPVVIAPSEPWESYGISAWTHVLRVSSTEDRMYYDCVEGSIRGPGRRICLAVSADGGLTWAKPVLHVFDRTDPSTNVTSNANNIVLEESGNSVFIDPNPAAPPSQRWKMTCSDAAYASPDGLRWTRMGKNGTAPTKQMDDTKPTGNWDPALQKYVIFVRRDLGGRHIGRCVTPDFSNWEAESPRGCPVVFGADPQDKALDPTIDVYTNSWTPYPSISSPAVHLFFPSMFHHFSQFAPFPEPGADGLLDIRVLSARSILGNLSYTSAANARSPFVPLGVNDCGASTPSVPGGWCDPTTDAEARTSFDTSTMYMASGFLPSHDGHQLHLYSSGSPNTHGEWQPGKGPGGRNAWGNNSGVQLLRLRKDGFVSVDAPYPSSSSLATLPGFTTVSVTVPAECAPPVPRPLPGPGRGGANVTCSYALPGGRCDAGPGTAGWHNVTCAADTDCSRLCGACHCTATLTTGHGVAATCRPHSDGGSYCNTGQSGGEICHAVFPPGSNGTGLVGGVQLRLNVETSVAGFVVVEVLDRKGEPVAGMAAGDADRIKGSTVGAVASWQQGALATLSRLAGQPIQLRVLMADARLFAIRLACAPTPTMQSSGI